MGVLFSDNRHSGSSRSAGAGTGRPGVRMPRTPSERHPASLEPQTGRRPGRSPRRPGRQRCPWRQPWSLVRRTGGAATGSARPRGRPEPSSCDAWAGKTPSVPSAGLHYGLALSAQITLTRVSMSY
ncbi:hypothetical protein IscW_ISCW007867 [Ixodes scapularis]|uniref:Uncharacterized protein n=1 Tax=Ixodes scapularis TaxID=6945 RepID=B7PVC2_IXOSC|nr:hypothetical protein IscW_ISCW007867 [Ixodes scapularis]|eukprot:XP_002407726.1 hypothetical protein IscW_ISCW007867 [Ixodes scapularis]